MRLSRCVSQWVREKLQTLSLIFQFLSSQTAGEGIGSSIFFFERRLGKRRQFFRFNPSNESCQVLIGVPLGPHQAPDFGRERSHRLRPSKRMFPCRREDLSKAIQFRTCHLLNFVKTHRDATAIAGTSARGKRPTGDRRLRWGRGAPSGNPAAVPRATFLSLS